jgi:hypothetical protein
LIAATRRGSRIVYGTSARFTKSANEATRGSIARPYNRWCESRGFVAFVTPYFAVQTAQLPNSQSKRDLDAVV